MKAPAVDFRPTAAMIEPSVREPDTNSTRFNLLLKGALSP